jgi:hypothetical protein
MGLKLRRVVTYTYTPRGVLVRSGANVVAITGVGVRKAFALLQKHLDGSWTRDQICAAVPIERQAALGHLIDALEKGQMMYSADASERSASLPWMPDDDLRLARIESSCDRPVDAFERARVTPITLSGPAWLTVELAEACAEAGMTNVATFDVLTPEAQARMRETVRIVAIDLAGSPESGEQLLDVDVSEPMVPLIVYGDKILVGSFDQTWPTACVRCLMAAYQDAAAPKAPVARPQLQLGAALAARVLLQRWLDLRTGVVPAESAALFYTIDLRSRHIALHPLPPNPACAHCRALVSTSVGRGHRHVTDPGSADTVLPRTYKYFTDPTTGILESIQEGDLVQLPLRQSAASWRDPLDRTRKMWTIEAAADIRSARASAAASAFELYVSDLLAASGGSSLAVLGLEGPLAPNWLASGSTPEQARARALFRAAAHCAQHSGSWRSANVNEAEGWTRANLVMAYLADTGHGSRLTVERHRQLDDDAVRVRRFSYDGMLVSVVAGTEEEDIWAVGLAAVWLHIAATDPAQRPQGTRRVSVYRDGVSPDCRPGPTEDVLEQHFGRRLELVPLTVPALSPLAPLCFVAATLRSATPFDRTNRHPVDERSVGDGAIAGVRALSSLDASGHDEP